METITSNIAKQIAEDVKNFLLLLNIDTEFNVELDGECAHIESKPIPMIPRLYKTLIVKGYIYFQVKKDNDAPTQRIIVELEYEYTTFGGSSNGTRLGTIAYNLLCGKNVSRYYERIGY